LQKYQLLYKKVAYRIAKYKKLVRLEEDQFYLTATDIVEAMLGESHATDIQKFPFVDDTV
jgi:hypothetical protein